MISRFLLTLTLVLGSFLTVDAAGTDAWATRTALSGAVVNSSGNNTGYTVEAGEETFGGLCGATCWWRWTAPATGWVKIDTSGSEPDTVLGVFTGSSLAGQTLIGYNDDEPTESDLTSMLTFFATAGVVYNISVGGWAGGDPLDAENGVISLHIAQNAAAVPNYFPASLSFAPANPNVTSGAASITTTYQLTGLAGTGAAEVFFVRPDGVEFTPVADSVSMWDAGAAPPDFPSFEFNVPQYSVPGLWRVVFRITPDDLGLPVYEFGESRTGYSYVLPPAAAVAKTMTVANTGPVDDTPPVVTSITVTPLTLDVTSEEQTIQVTAEITDDLSGADHVVANIWHPELYLTAGIPLELSTGTAVNGTWTGIIVVPRNFPTATYDFAFLVEDKAQNSVFYSPSIYDELLPGGDITIPVTGGGVFHEWLYESYFQFTDIPGTELLDSNNDQGISNLLCYAFNVDAFFPEFSIGSLPEIELSTTAPDGRLLVTYLRRTAPGSGLTYLPQFTSDPAGTWTAGTEIGVEPVDDEWELVTAADTETIATAGRRSGRVKVTYVEP